MKKYFGFGVLLGIASLQAMDGDLREEIAFFRAVAAGQLRVTGKNQIAFPGYGPDTRNVIKSPQEVKRLYEAGIEYMAACRRMNNYEISTDETANWIFKMFESFVENADIELPISILNKKDPDMASFLEESRINRLLESSKDPKTEFCAIIDEIKEKREHYKDGLASGESGKLQAVLDLPINLFSKPLHAIAYDRKNKKTGAQLIPEPWSPSAHAHAAQEKY